MRCNIQFVCLFLPSTLLKHSLYSLEPLPDPIKLLRRINALEHSVQALRQDCSDMMARRQVAVLEAVTQLDSLRDLFQNEVSDDIAF